MTGGAAVLRAKIGAASPALTTAASRLWSAPSPRERYADYLYAMHGVVRSSVPLLQAALVRCREVPDDGSAATLARYYATHIAEERGHDEWLRQDITAAGHDPDDALRKVPSASVAALAGAQYYWIRHYHPVMLLGYIAALEGQPPSPGLPARLAAATGYPLSAFRALSGHAAADPGHGEEVFRILDLLPLTAAQQAAVGVSALHTVAGAVRLLLELAARSYRAGDADV